MQGDISLYFWFAFPQWLVILSIFPCGYWPFVDLLWRCPFKSSAHCSIGLTFSDWVLGVLYIVYVLTTFQIYDSQVISSHSVGLLSTLLIVSFDARNFKIFMNSNLSIFTFVSCAIGVILKKSMPNPTLWSFCPMSSKSFYGFRPYI